MTNDEQSHQGRESGPHPVRHSSFVIRHLSFDEREQSVMATPVQNPPRPAVIRMSPLEGRSGAAAELLRVLPAWVISPGIHALLFFLFSLIVVEPEPLARADPSPTETINTKVEAPQKDVPLTNLEEGLDPTVPAGLDIARK